MKRKTITNITALFLLLLAAVAVQAQVDDKGVTSTGKEIDCFTITPEDRVVNEYGAIVTQPRLTHNGKIITDDCCPTLDETSLTDLVTCTSISMAAKIQKGSFKGGYLLVFSDENYQNRVDSVTASEADSIITAKATGLTCYTHYYFKLILNGQCEYVWTDSTRDATLEKATYCTVANILTTAVSETDLSREHKYNGSGTQIDSVYDHQGNAYAVVQIGDQCWLKENMRCTTSPTNLALQQLTSGTDRFNPRYYDYVGATQFTLRERGYLYNWAGAMDKVYTESNMPGEKDFPQRRGICPSGWHLPTDAEWKTLEKGFLTMSDGSPITNTILNNLESRGKCAGRFTGGCTWGDEESTTSPSSYKYADRNISGFSALPTGSYEGTSSFVYAGDRANFWSSTSYDKKFAYNRRFARDLESVYRYNANKSYGRSVRCLRNPQYAVYPNVDTVSCTSMNITAQVIGLGTLTIKTVCAYTDESCTTGQICAASVTANATNDTISATVTGLSCNTRYYIKVTATDGTHSVEAVITDSTRDMTLEKATFCTVISALALSEGSSDLSREHLVEGSTTEIDSVYDHEGNAYAVVQIGNQCWLRENMRCTTSPSGNLRKGNGEAVSATMAYFYDNTDDEKLTPRMRGMLYNWEGAMDTTGTLSTSAIYTNRRGICPKGWHLPTDDEWFTLETKELSGIPPTSGTAYRGTGVGKLTGGCDWTISGSGEETQPGNYFYSERNITGLFLVPAGYYNGSTFTDVSKGATLWSSTILSDGSVYYRGLKFSEPGMGRNNSSTVSAFSVRCVRNVCESTADFVIGTDEVHGTAKVVYTADENYTYNWYKNDTLANTGTMCSDTGTYRVVAVNADGCTKTKDVTVRKVLISCTVAAARTWNGTDNDHSHEHGFNGSTTQIDSVYDYEGNAYSVVQIGNQCWMRQNMKSTTLPSTGTQMSLVTGNGSPQTYTSPTCFINLTDNGCTDFKDRYGVLYNWSAVMDLTGSAINNNPAAPHRGICPAGWHVPTDAEFTVLCNAALESVGFTGTPSPAFSSSTSTTNPEGANTPISTVLSGGTDWVYKNSTSVGGDYENVYRDAVHFTVLPARNWDHGTFYSVKERADFWTATTVPSNNGDAYGRNVHYNMAGVTRYTYAKNANGRSLRCVRDAQAKTYCSVDLKLDNENSSVDGRIDSVSDHEGNWYKVVEIGEQCWLAENMRATTEPNGTNILQKLHSGSSYSAPRAYYYGDDAANFAKYGCLYNFPGAMNINDQGTSFTYPHRGICPEGWHVPTDDEWTTLTSSAQVGVGSGTGAGKLAGGSDWYNTGTTTTPNSYSYADRNVTGFSALPAGDYTGSNFGSVREHAYFWSATPDGIDNAYNRYFYYNIEYVYRSKRNRGYGFSVRCVRNTPASATISFNANGGSGSMTPMSVTTMKDTVLNLINTGTITHAGNFEFAGWGTDQCSSEIIYTDGGAITPTESMTLYAQWISYCDASSIRAQVGSDQSREHAYNNSTDKIDSVYDHQGNRYAVVQIGNQCWLKENMRATTEPTAPTTSIIRNSGASTTEKYAYYPGNNAANAARYGMLYNWRAAMNGENTLGARGICPAGWHVPTNAEWKTLADSAHVGVNAGNNAGKLAGGCEWKKPDASPTGPADYSYSERNITGFNALPAGGYNGTVFGTIGDGINFWSCNSTYYQSLNCNRPYVTQSTFNGSNGCSVRCVRDAQAKNYCTVDLKLDNENSSVAGRIDSVSDHEGNWYKVVEIGEQCWLAENMRATTEPTDPTKSIVFNSSVGSSSTEPRAFYYLNNEANYAKYGALYNFPATMNYTGDLPAFVHPHRGICPEGWHVPEDAEWTTMEKTVAPDGTGLHNNLTVDILLNNADYQASNTDLAVRLSSGNDWDGNGYAGITPNSYDNSSRNSTGFSALPAGDYRNAFYDINQNAYFMSSTIWNFNSTPLVICRGLYYMYSGMNRNAYNLTSYYSLRCVRNTPASATINFHANGGTGTMEAMSVTTMTNTVLSANSFTHEGNWAFTGWNTKMDGTGTAYDDQAHITPTESITLYAQWHTWCDASSVRAQSGTDLSHEHGYNGATDKIDSVYDHQGNAYAVVQIGNQCWLKENMRATTSPRQGVVNLIEGTSGSDKDNPRYYDCGPNKYSGQVVTNDRARGYLYNWAAAIDTSNASSITNDLPNRRGICPAGWHVPTNGELTAMSSLAGVGKEETSKGLGKLTGGCDWNTSSSATAPGNYSYSERNSTGFSALPVGFYDGSRCTNAGDYAYFWSATPKDGNDAYYRRLYYNYEYVNITSNPKEYGYSVRCVRNN